MFVTFLGLLRDSENIFAPSDPSQVRLTFMTLFGLLRKLLAAGVEPAIIPS